MANTGESIGTGSSTGEAENWSLCPRLIQPFKSDAGAALLSRSLLTFQAGDCLRTHAQKIVDSPHGDVTTLTAQTPLSFSWGAANYDKRAKDAPPVINWPWVRHYFLPPSLMNRPVLSRKFGRVDGC